MKPTPKNKLVPRIHSTTAVELDPQQLATLNRLVLENSVLTDDEAQSLWQAINPWVREFQHSNPRDIFSSLRFFALAKPYQSETEPQYSTDLLNEVRSDIEFDDQSCMGW
ncbi:hypothetical protein ACSYAD_33500 [Acaryochloris marina NIES-2412]|uniref:hypothetical protein n=1 Tax=Acaryochloris marina TaxID=155978 RepID=UPI00405A383E